MKHFARLALVLASLAGWSSAYSLDVSELCADFNIFKDPETRIYRGAFEKKGVTLDHVLVVAEVTDEGKALAFYVHGKQPKWRIKEPGCTPGIGIFEDDTLTFGVYKATVTYKFADDGTASVQYVPKRGRSSTTHGRVALEK